MSLLLATILPSILIILFFVYSDKFKEPRGEIIKVFIYGILITIPAYFLNTFISNFFYANTRVSEGLISSFLFPSKLKVFLSKTKGSKTLLL